MPTKVGIWNEALTVLGRSLVNNDEATGEVGRLFTNLWERVPNAVLEEYDWNSAIVRIEIQRLDETPAHGYDYYFQMPNDWAKIVQLNDTGEERDPFEDWREEQGKIATNAERLYLWYVSEASVDSIGRWSQALADYVAAEMAVRGAPLLAPKLLEFALDNRKRKRRLAMSLDARSNPPKRHTPGTWVRSRLGGIRNATESGR